MKTYLYLARRDKKEIKILVHLSSKEKVNPRRVDDLTSLNLPAAWEKAIGKMIYDDRMKWEPWMQSAESFTEFRNNLYKRGYKHLPMHSTPKIIMPNLRSEINEPKSKPRPRTMIRKKKGNN